MFVPLAVTENVTDSPAHFVAPAGPTEIDGGVLTVNVAAPEVTDGEQDPLTTTSYEPASPAVTEAIV